MRRLLPAPCRDDFGSAAELEQAYAVTRGDRQYVRANMVATADGATSEAGRTATLSGPTDQRIFALLRAQADVILVGAGTARAEQYGGHRPSDARRRWRQERGLPPAAPIAVVTRECAFSRDSLLFTDTVVRNIVITRSAAPAARRSEVAEVADLIVAGDEEVDIARALDALAERGLQLVSCEGGPTLLAHVVAAGRLDELCLTTSPLLFAGEAGRVLHGPALLRPARLRLRLLLEDDGFLFARYDVSSPSPSP